MKGSDEVHFEGQNREEIYGWVNETLHQQHDSELGRTGRGVVLDILMLAGLVAFPFEFGADGYR